MYLLVFISTLVLFSYCHGIGRWDVFSTKTIYKWSHTVSATVDESYSFSSGSKTCKAIHVNMVSRHGARWPSDGDMEDIQKLHDKIIASKSNTTYPGLDSWLPRYNLSDESQLVTEGKTEQQQIGLRTGTRFKTLFDNNGDYVKFVSSRKARTKDSNENFYKGLSTIIQSLPDYSNEVNDTLIRFYDECSTYEETVESDANLKQFSDFSKSLAFLKIAESVKSKLGVSFDLSEDYISIINELCAFEKYIFNEETVWCDLLTDAERLLLEYRADIENYYESSYGHPMNSKIMCPLVRDMFYTMDRAINNTWDYSNLGNVKDYGYLAGKFYNGHSDTLTPLMTLLQLFKDSQPLLSTNMAEMTNRKFKTSTVCPFSANIAFVVYACDDSVNLDRSFMVKLFVNEQSVTIPACGTYTCTYNSVRQYYVDLIDKCDLEQMCKADDGSDECIDGKNDDKTCSSNSTGGNMFIVLFPFLYFYA